MSRYVKRLRLRNPNRLMANVIRNQQRNRRTLNEALIASVQEMDYHFAQLVGLPVPRRYGPGRRSFAR